VVGGLVEQQHVGAGHQRLRQRHTLFHAARQVFDRQVGREPQALQRLFDALLPVPAVSARPSLTVLNTVAPGANVGSWGT
jgi:hypothetical protein